MAPSRWEGPTSALSYILVSLAMTMSNKYAISVWQFPSSSMLLLLECIATVVLLYAGSERSRYKPLSAPILRFLPSLTLAKAVNMYLSFMAMERTSIPVYNVLKRLNPVFSLGVDRVVRHAKATPGELLGVLLICAGALTTGAGDLEFDPLGYGVATLAAVGQSLYIVLARHASDKVPGLSHVDLLFYTAFFNLAIFGPLSSLDVRAVVKFCEAPGEIQRVLWLSPPYVFMGAGTPCGPTIFSPPQAQAQAHLRAMPPQGHRRVWQRARDEGGSGTGSAEAAQPAVAAGRWRSKVRAVYLQPDSPEEVMQDDGNGEAQPQPQSQPQPPTQPRVQAKPTRYALPQEPLPLPLAARSVCVIGGGPAGLGCCRALCEAGLKVTLVQESRGLGGKLCTKFVNGKEDPRLHFDMGVQLLRPEGPFRGALDPEVVQPWPLPGRFKRITCSGSWKAWRIVSTVDLPTDGCVVGVPSMSSLGRHLASLCPNLTIHLDRTGNVRGQDPKTLQWEVEWKREAPTATQLRYRPELADVPAEVGRADFDAVFLAFEANKILRGCKSGYKMVSSSSTEGVRKQIQGRARTSQVWNIMVAFDEELPMPWDAASLEGHPALAWVAINSSKPQRVRTPQCFMVLSTRSWADYKQWGRREVEQELLEELLDLLQAVLGRRPPKPSFVLGGRWGNNTESVLTGARPVGEFPMRALNFEEETPPVVWDAQRMMGATGDWICGFSVSDAYNAGIQAASPLIDDLQALDKACGA